MALQVFQPERYRILRRGLPSFTGSAFESLLSAFSLQLALMASGVLAARMLAPEDRGYLAIISLVALVVNTIVIFGSDSALAFYVARSPHRTKGIVSTIIVPGVFQAVVSTLVQAAALICLLHGEPQRVMIAGLVSLAIGPLVTAQTYGLRIFQGLQKFRQYHLWRFAPSGIYSICLVFLFVLGVSNLFMVVLAWTAGYALSVGYLLIAMKRLASSWGAEASDVSWRDISRFGAKGFLGSASPLETFRLDQLAVGLFLSPAMLGIYVTSLAFTNLPRVVAQSLSTIALPHIASAPTGHQARRTMWQFFVVTLACASLIAIAVALMADMLVPFFFGSSYEDAVGPARILLFGSVLFACRRILGESLRGMGNAGASTAAEIGSWIVLLPSLALLAPRWELNGVSVAIVVASSVSLGVIVVRALGSSSDGVDETR